MLTWPFSLNRKDDIGRQALLFFVGLASIYNRKFTWTYIQHSQGRLEAKSVFATGEKNDEFSFAGF